MSRAAHVWLDECPSPSASEENRRNLAGARARISNAHFSSLPDSVFSIASTRPCLIAATRAAWSRSVWSP